jgi:hypothetical protein
VSPGLTLFMPMGGDSTVYLIDLGGEVVHTWCMPYPALSGYLTERDTLVYNGRIDCPDDNFLSSSPWKGGVLLEVDWSGEVVWEVRHPDHHHDGIRLANGNALLLCAAEVPGGGMYADYLIEMTTDGRCVWEWRSWEHLNPDEFPIVHLEDSRSEWTCANSVVELADGDLMVGFQHASSVIIIDRESGTAVRQSGPLLATNPLRAAP